MKVDMNLLPMKGHYFLYNAGTGLVIPFMPVLGKELGFSSVVVGTIYTMLPILALVAKPTMGAIADRFHCQKGIFISFIILTMLSLFIIPWVPSPRGPPPTAGFHCDAVSDLKVCAKDFGKMDQLAKTPFNCNVNCQANATFIKQVCNEWKEPQLCTPPVEEGKMQTLKFAVKLNPEHFSLMKDCLFMRVMGASFNPGNWTVPYCDGFSEASCSLTSCEDPDYVNLLGVTKETFGDWEVIGMYQFWLFCLSLVIGWVSMAIVVSISDAICFELLGDFPSRYGNQRLWGAVGWGVLSFCGGLVIDYFSRGKATKDHTPAFILMAVFLFLNVIVAWKLKYTQVKSSSSILRDVGRLLSEGQVLIFLLWCVVTGMCTAMVWNFLFWHLEKLADKDAMANMKTLEGLAMIIQCLGGELPFFFLSGRVLKKIGHVHSMSLVLVTFCIRFFLYSLLANPWWVLPIEFLNGLTFGMAYATMASYASIVAPPGTESTTQGLVGAVFEGVGVSLGSFIGGILMNQYPGSVVFRVCSCFALVSCVIHALGQFYFSKKTAILNIHEKDLSAPLLKDFRNARYASPRDAIHMVEDNFQDFNTPR